MARDITRQRKAAPATSLLALARGRGSVRRGRHRGAGDYLSLDISVMRLLPTEIGDC